MSFRPPKLLLVILLLMLILCFNVEANDHRSILVLHSYHRGFAWDDSIDQGITEIMTDHPNVNVRTEYMDTKRIHDQEYYAILLKTYQHKFAGLHFDVVISTDNNALNFLLKYRDQLFPDTPVVFCGVNNFEPSMLGDAKGFTGVTESIAVQRTLDVAIDLNPEIKHVYVFGTSSNTYRGNKAMFLQAMPSFENKLEFNFYDEVNIEQAIEVLGLAPKNSIAFIIAFLRDKDGSFVTFEEATTIISERSDIPLFGLWDYLLDHGVVGGLVISGLAQGESAALIALEIINKKDISEIPFLLTSPNRYIFDYQQLQRFSLNQENLPEGSTVINVPYSFYSEHKLLIWIVASSFAGLIVIIVFLIMNIRYRKSAETKLAVSENQYRTTLDSMGDIIHVMDTDFNLVLANQALKQQSMDLGITEDVIGKNLFSLFPFLPDTIREELQQVTKSGKLLVTEEKIAIEGEERYTETRKIPVLSNGRVNQIVTILRDISTRKKAEERIKDALVEKETLLQEIHHRVKNNMQIIASLLRLQLNRESKQDIDAILKQNIGRVYSMAAIHESLHQSDKLSEIDFKAYLQKLTGMLSQTFSVDPGKVSFQIEIPELILAIDMANPLGLVLNELISNSLKYAFPKERKGIIKIKSDINGNEIELIVADEGIGFPDGFDWENSSSLGLKLVQNLVDNQLGGSIELDKTNGTKFTIKFNLESNYK